MSAADPFAGLARGHYGAIPADPPWSFRVWSGKGMARAPDNHYPTMGIDDIAQLPITDLAAPDCALFYWICWPSMPDALRVIEAWGFQFKTCAFSWLKADPYRLFADEFTPSMGCGYWTRANTEACLLATRGKPRRLNADVRQGIIAPRREHSRKPDCIHERIERLVAGPYLELFARQQRAGWDAWGDQVGKFGEVAA
jgi:N6-adenosine-specific RNA methylase IME4